jgi:PAS domain S-box-containing protein
MTDDTSFASIDGKDSPLAGLIGRFQGQPLEADDFFRHFVNALPAAIYATDPDGYVTYFNEACAAIWGCRPELGKAKWCGSWRLFWPDGRELPHDQCPMAVAVKERRVIRGLEAVVERPDGSRVWLIPNPTPIYDDSGTFLGALNLLVDISDRKRVEEAAHRLAAIVESSNDAIYSVDLDGVIQSWNAGAEQIFGYAAEEIIGKSIKGTLIPPDHDAQEDASIERLLAGQLVETYEAVRRRKDGSLFDVSLTVSPIKDACGSIVGASRVVRNITEHKRAEAQVAVLAREAEHRTKNILATVAATVRLSHSDTADGLKKAIEGRIQALANAHALFVESGWAGADLRTLVVQELAPYSQDGEMRAEITGANVVLEPSSAQSIAMALHELATNSAKYGALSRSQGRLDVRWSRSPAGRLVIDWIETGGPRVAPPKHNGFGTRVMQAVIQQAAGEIRFHWHADGLACEIILSV